MWLIELGIIIIIMVWSNFVVVVLLNLYSSIVKSKLASLRAEFAIFICVWRREVRIVELDIYKKRAAVDDRNWAWLFPNINESGCMSN